MSVSCVTMENKRTALNGNLPFLEPFRRHSPRRYVLSFTCASGNPCILSLSTDKGLEEIQDGTLDYFRKHTYNRSALDCYTNHIYIKAINGFTCFAREGHVAFRKVATSEEFHLPWLHGYSDYQRRRSLVHFCHDPANDKYKVVITTQGDDALNNYEVVNMRFSVFTLGVDNSWRNFHRKGLSLLGACNNSKRACVNGVAYSTNFSTSRDFEDGVIAAFDVGRECFEIVRYPDGLSPTRYSGCDLMNVKGSIAVADVQDDGGNSMIRLWVKVAGFGSDLWLEHRIQFPLPLENISIKSCEFSFTTNGNGEMVVGMAKISSPRCWVFCHNLETGEWGIIGMFLIKGHAIFSNFFIDEYVENPSLLRDFRALNLNN